MRYLTNQDLGANPRVNQWSNGTDPAKELNRLMELRRVALSRFGENAIKRDMPMAQIEEVLVPLYLHHRYQVEAAADALGGMHYIYAMRGDGRVPVTMATAAEQRATLTALMATLSPAALALPEALLRKIPPRPSGYGRTRELFPRYTGLMFDAITPAVVAADLVTSFVAHARPRGAPRRAEGARPVVAGARGCDRRPVCGELRSSVAHALRSGGAARRRECRRRGADHARVECPDAAGAGDRDDAAAAAGDDTRARDSREARLARPVGAIAQASSLAAAIKRFLERPAAVAPRLTSPDAPPGAPLGRS